MEKPLGMNFQDVSKLSPTIKTSVWLATFYDFIQLLKKIKRLIEKKNLAKFLAKIEVGQYLPDRRPGSDYSLGVSAKKHLGGGFYEN